MKKGSKLLLLTITSVAVTIAAAACGDKHEHTYGTWQITTAPTADAAGEATRVCTGDDSHTETLSLPALSDANFWTYSVTQDATHVAAGKAEYTNAANGITVEVTLEMGEHTFGGAWVITTEPTATEAGEATQYCTAEDGGTQTMELPVLTDTDFWTHTVTKQASCSAEGAESYTNETYNLTVNKTIAKLAHTPSAFLDYTVKPSETTEGKVCKVCTECGERYDAVTLPVLTDTSFWELATGADYEYTAPTHTTEGEATYLHNQGNVTVYEVFVTLPKRPHTFTGAEWVFLTEPTLNTAGSAQQHCTAEECEGLEESVSEPLKLPALSDTSFWTAGTPVAPTVNHAGYTPYTNAEHGITYQLVTADKLPAPYDNQTYSAVIFEPYDEATDGTVSMQTSWLGATLVVGENGSASGESYPFRGTHQLAIREGNIVTWTDESNRDYQGIADLTTKIMVFARTLNDRLIIFVPTPEGGLKSGAATASTFMVGSTRAIAIHYAAADMNIFIYGDEVLLGVTFETMAGETVAAADCYNAPSLYVKSGEETSYMFGFNGTEVVALDGYQGTYTGTMGDASSITLSGFGTVTAGEKSGTYTVMEENVVGVTVDGSFYQVTLNTQAGTFEAAQPQVTITYDAGEYATVNEESVPMGEAHTLPTPENATHLFRGWYTDAQLATPVDATYTPMADVTLYAKWVKKVTLNLYFEADGAATTITVGVGDVFGDIMADYAEQVADTETHYFDGWFAESTFDNAIANNTEIPDTTVINAYAKWVGIPVYAGTYKGNNTYSADRVGTSVETVTIDVRGNVTGEIEGTVSSYDPETGIIMIGTTRIWFSNGVIAFNYSGRTGATIGTDMYTLVKSNSDTPIQKNAQISGPTRLVSYLDEAGATKVVLITENRIYADVAVTNAFGDALAVENVRASKTVIVTPAAGGEIILAAGSDKATIGTSGATISALDSFYGTYTGADGELKLDGAGSIRYSEKEGTYALQADSQNVFDVYLDGNKEYYVLTLDVNAKTYTIEKPTAQLTFVSEHSTHDAVTLNVNIAYTLPQPTAAGYVFRGWYTTAEYTGEPLTQITAANTTAITLHAKWLAEVSVTANLNYAGADEATVYDGIGAGETLAIDAPKRDGYRFLGWFTQATEGEEWVSGSAVNATITIYAHWGEAPAYAGTYYGGNIYSITSGASNLSTKLTIDADGVISDWGTGSGYTVTALDAETGVATITKGTNTRYIWIDTASNVIVSGYSLASTTTLGGDIYFFYKSDASIAVKHVGLSYKVDAEGNFSTGTGTSDYLTRFIEVDGNFLLLFNGKFYNTFTATTVAGEALESVDAIKAASTLVVTVDGEQLFAAAATKANFGTSSCECRKLDGKQGSYTGTLEAGKEGTLVLDGNGGVVFGEATGTYTVFEDGALGVTITFAENDKAYYEVTLATGAFTADKPMVTISFTTEHGSAQGMTVNKNIEVTLPVPTSETHIFQHWKNGETVLGETFAPTQDVTLTAVWAKKVTVTVIYGEGLEQVVKYYQTGDEVTLSDLAPETIYVNGKLFTGWKYTEGEAIIDSTITLAETDISITAVWEESAPYVINTAAQSSAPGSGTAATFTWKEAGYYESDNKAEDSSKATLSLEVFVPGSVSLEWMVSSESGYDKLSIYLRGSREQTLVSEKSGEIDWTALTADLEAGDKLYVVYTKDGSGDEGDDCARVRNLVFTAFDMSVAGDYTGAQGTVNLDGRGKITLTPSEGAAQTGTYEKAAENTYDVFFKQDGKAVSHYTLVTTAEKTYTLTAVTAVVTLDMNGHGTAPTLAGTIYDGVELTLPTPAEVAGWIFKGWAMEASSTTYITTVTPNKDAETTIYAQWKEAVTLTIVYGAHGGVAESAQTFSIEKDTTIDLATYEPAYDSGFSFDKWHEGNAATGAEVTDTSITMTEAKTFYASYKEGAAFEVTGATPTGSGKVFSLQESGEWRTAAGQQTENIYLKVVIYASGTLTFDWKAIDGDPDGDGVDSQMQYEVYGADGDKIGGTNRISGSMSTDNSASLDSLSWNNASIEVTAGTTVYLIFNRVWAGSNAQAAIANIQLA